MGQFFPFDQFEIIIVDNNSIDGTKRLVNEIKTSALLKISYVFETKQGLSNARNTGIDHAQGEIVLFMDDDADAGKNWLESMVKAFDDPGVAAAGGPVKPLWEEARPPWLPDTWLPYLSSDDFSDLITTKSFTADRCLVGTNMAFRKSALGERIRFPAALGRTGAKLTSNEEIVVCREILAHGGIIRFVPGAVVYHHVAPERLKKQWFYRRIYWQGRSDALISRDTFVTNLKNILIWSGVIAKNSLLNLLPGESSRFSATMMVCLHWGKLSGLFRNLLCTEEAPQ